MLKFFGLLRRRYAEDALCRMEGQLASESDTLKHEKAKFTPKMKDRHTWAEGVANYTGRRYGLQLAVQELREMLGRTDKEKGLGPKP